MQKKLLKFGLITLLLFSSVKANASILYNQNQVKQNIKLEKVVKRINQKYSKKNLEYFSRGFLQFKEQKFVQDSEINELIQGTYLTKEEKEKARYTIDGINFQSDYAIMIDSNFYHLGDNKKKWYPAKKDPEGTFYETKFTLSNIQDMENPKLGLEVFSADSDNKIYLNGKLIGFTPKISKKQWGNLVKKYKENTPFLYGELPVSEYLKKGENIVRIESRKSGIIFKNYDDFLIRRIQIVYNKNE